MPLTSPDSLFARLDRLERESRRWKRVALGSWVAIAALFLLGQSPPRPGGPGRAVDGTPALNLNGTDGRPRATMTLTAGRGAGLALANELGAVVWSAPP